MRRPSEPGGHRRAARRALRVVLFASVTLLSACGPPETDPNALRAADGSPLYRDGTYSASFSHTGPDGWLPFLQVRVRAGLITEVCCDAVDASGGLLSADELFLETYRLETGVELPTYLGGLGGLLLEAQRTPVRADRAAVEWAAAFELLARMVTDAARVGLTTDAAGVEQTTTAGPYYATDAPDELGWRSELVLVFDADGVAAAAYQEVRTELDGSLRVKRDDERYQELFEPASGITSEAVSSTLTGQLLASLSPRIDGVSGATVTTTRFVALATGIFSRREAAPLPSRFCR